MEVIDERYKEVIDERYKEVVEAIDHLARRFVNIEIRQIDPAKKSVRLSRDVIYQADSYDAAERAKRGATSGGSPGGSDSVIFLDSDTTDVPSSGDGGSESSTLLGSPATTTTSSAGVTFIEPASSGTSADIVDDNDQSILSSSTTTTTTTTTTIATASDEALSTDEEEDFKPRNSEEPPTILYDDDEQGLDETVPVVDESASNTTSVSQWSSNLLHSSSSLSLPPSSSSSASSSFSPPEELPPSEPEAVPTGLADLVPDAECAAIPPMQIDDLRHGSIEEYNTLLRQINDKELARAYSINSLKTMLRRIDTQQRTKSAIVDGGDRGPTRMAMEHYIKRSYDLRHEHARVYRRMLKHPGDLANIRVIFEQMFKDYDSLIENVHRVTEDLGARYFNEPRKTGAPATKKRGATLGITPVLEKRFTGRPVEFLPDQKQAFAFGVGPLSLWTPAYENEWHEHHNSLWNRVSFEKSPLVVLALDEQFREQLREISENIPNTTYRGLNHIVQKRLFVSSDAHRKDVFTVLIEYQTTGGLRVSPVTIREAQVAALFWIPQKISVGGVEKKIKLAFRATGESMQMSYRAYDVIVRISKNQNAPLFENIPTLEKVAFHLFVCNTSPVTAVPDSALIPKYTVPALSFNSRYTLHPTWVDQYRWIHALVADSYLYNTRHADAALL